MGSADGIAKRVLPLLLLALVLGAPGGACGGDEPSPCDYKEFGLDAAKFFVYLTKDTPYRSWRHWPDREATRPRGPHGPRAVTYVNPAAYDSIVRKEKMAYGSLIVMENRDPDESIRSLSVRIKIKGYNPEGGDWYWFAFAPDGTATAEGRAGACLGCHGKGKADDYVMGSPAK
ncbi:MAG: cytochrome P460 family protein [Syntrophales bacterium]